MSDDLISRQAAIDAVSQALKRVFVEPEDVANKIIEEVPSAEPERRWIPCKERLPEKGGRYLCTVGAAYRNPREMIYAPQEWSGKSDSATWKDPSGHYVFDWFVEAWQVLPEPYKEDEDELIDMAVGGTTFEERGEESRWWN